MIFTNLKRFYHPMRIPWRFDDKSPFPLTPVSEEVRIKLEKKNEGFIQSYKSLIYSLADQDFETLKSFSTNSLTNSFREAFLILKNRKHNLEIVNKDSIEEIDIKFFNEKVTITSPPVMSTIFENLINQRKALGLTGRDLKARKFDFEHGFDLQLHFEVSIFVSSPFKLVMTDENNQIVQGNSSALTEMHLVDFQIKETFKADNIFQQYISLIKMMIRMLDPFHIENQEWTISDVDNYLKNVG